MRSGHWAEKDLLGILPLVDAIETFNARCMQASYNRQAQAFAREHGVLGTVGSDAHAAFELGRATLLLPDFHDAESLRQALPQAKAYTPPLQPVRALHIALRSVEKDEGLESYGLAVFHS